MKTTTVIAALAGIALLALPSPVRAQYKPVGDDGIAASPKLRQQLGEYKINNTTAPAPAQVAAMPCPKCKDKVTTKVDWTARGANKPTVLVVTHLCNSCDNTIVTTGVGKNATSVAAHKCTSGGVETLACCNTMKDSGVAPLQ